MCWCRECREVVSVEISFVSRRFRRILEVPAKPSTSRRPIPSAGIHTFHLGPLLKSTLRSRGQELIWRGQAETVGVADFTSPYSPASKQILGDFQTRIRTCLAVPCENAGRVGFVRTRR